MWKKFFIAAICSVITFLAAQLNICGAMIAPYQMYLGGLTYGSKIDEMKNLHGEPDTIFDGVDGYTSCTYGNKITVQYKKVSGQIYSIDVTDENGWKADGGIGVGMYFDEWLKIHAEPEVVKVGDVQTVYLYFHYKSNPVLKETFRDYGLFIVFNNKSGKITRINIFGDNDFAPFEESYENIMEEMLVPIEK